MGVQKNNDTIQNKKDYVLYNIHSNTIKGRNNVYARTALLKAAELVSSFSSDGSRFHDTVDCMKLLACS